MPKYVKKANQWCVTYFIKGKQKQEWFSTEEGANKFERNDKNR